MSSLEWSRSVAFEAYQEARIAGLPPATIFPNADAQIAAEKADEEKVRAFLVDQKILSVPELDEALPQPAASGLSRAA